MVAEAVRIGDLVLYRTQLAVVWEVTADGRVALRVEDAEEEEEVEARPEELTQLLRF